MDREKELKKIVAKQAKSYLKHMNNGDSISTTYTKLNESGLLTVPGIFVEKLKSDFFNEYNEVAKRAQWEYNSNTGTLTLELFRNNVKMNDIESSEKMADESDYDDEPAKCVVMNSICENPDDAISEFDKSYASLSMMIPLLPDEKIVPYNMGLYIKSLLIIAKRKMYMSYTKTAPYKFVRENLNHATEIKYQYEYELTKRFIKALIAAYEVKRCFCGDKEPSYEERRRYMENNGFERAYRFIHFATDSCFGTDSIIYKNMYDRLMLLDDAISNSKPVTINFETTVTDYLMMKIANSMVDLNVKLKSFMDTLFIRWANDSNPNTSINMDKALVEYYLKYVSDYVEGKLQFGNPVAAEALLAVFLPKYPDVMNKRSLNEFDIFKIEHVTINKMITREFNTHVYNSTGSNFIFSEATLR